MKPNHKPKENKLKKPIYKTINYTYIIYTDYGHSAYVCKLYIHIYSVENVFDRFTELVFHNKSKYNINM